MNKQKVIIMNIMKKIFEKKVDDSLHRQFVRFGPGTFEARGVVRVKIGAKKMRMWTSFEYGNYILKYIADHTEDDSIMIKGKIFSKTDFKLDFEKIHEKKKGFYISTIDAQLPTENLQKIVKDLADEYILLDVTTSKATFKIKKSPHNPRGKFDDKYCKISLDNEFMPLVEDLLFGLKGKFKEAIVDHMIIITEVVADEKLLQKDATAARLAAKRKGKLVRNLTVDGETEVTEVDFLI